MMIIFLLLSVTLAMASITNIEALSIDQCIKALKLLDKIELNNQEYLDFEILINEKYHEQLRSELYQIILQNVSHKSLFMKLLGLVTIENIILISMIFIGIGFLISLSRDIIAKWLLDKNFMYTFGLVISVLMISIKVELIENHLVKLFFIFDWLTPFFGCILFGVITFMISYDDKKSRTFFPFSLINTIVFACAALYHENWLIGVITIVMLFLSCSFNILYKDHYNDRLNEASMIRCALLSIILNICFIAVQMGWIENYWFISIFETGILFWGTLIGSLSMLILSLYYTKMTYVIMQFLMGFYCFALIYIGNLLWISNFKSIGSTFLILWGLNLERKILSRFNRGYMTATLAVIFINLYGLYQLIINFREYFIF